MRRRSFVRGAGALASAWCLGTTAERLFAAAGDDRYDLIVVGAGTAGIPAAIFAAERGARVLMIDAAADIGGTLHLSTGQMSAAGTRLQAELGIRDSAQAHYDDVMRISKNTADPEIVRLAVDHAAVTFDWLMDGGFKPLPDHPVLGQGHEPYSEKRYYWGADGGRTILAMLRPALAPHVASGRVSILLSSPVTALLTDDAGAVEAVRVKSALSETVFRGRHVLLSCGGYVSNPEMFERLSGVRDYGDNGYAYSMGAGIELGVSVGGFVRGRENYLSNFGSILADDNFPAKMFGRFTVIPQQRQPWEIFVNARGERFIREDEPSFDKREMSLLDQPDLRYWIVFDERIFAEAPPGVGGFSRDEMRDAFDVHSWFVKADSLEELANKAGINPAGLQQSVADYNRGVARQQDRFGRLHLPRPISKGPYYAIRHQGHSTTSTVGLAVNGALNVVRARGEPVRNLYAAGELLGAGQLMGQSFVGGMMVTPALTFGRLLGQRLPFGRGT
jgi:fumarate reductase flavoprotein subunit